MMSSKEIDEIWNRFKLSDRDSLDETQKDIRNLILHIRHLEMHLFQNREK